MKLILNRRPQILQIIGSKVVSFEQQDTDLKLILADAYEADEDFTNSAKTLQTITLESSQRQVSDDEKAKIWPKVSVDVTWCEKSAWVMIDAAWWVQTLQDEAKAKGIKGREVKFTMFREANHFVRSFIAIVEKIKADIAILAPLGHTREGC